MFRIVLSWFKYLFVLCLLLFATNNFLLAEELSPEGKILFVYADNIGETSYYISDILSNDSIMGLSILNKKLAILQKMVVAQKSLAGPLSVSKKTVDLLDKFNKEVDSCFKNYDYDRKKLLMAKDSFALYSESLRDDIEKLYGPKLTWLFDTTFLASFTEQSMSSDYKNKLVLLQFRYLLDYMPYKLPTSVITSISNIATVDDSKLTSTQVELIREASQNVLKYFSNPDAYTPPATLSDLVGKWEGRLSTPDGVYHKAEIEIKPDLSAVINVDNIFKDMPINAISLTQTVIGFDVKPYGDDSLAIKFSGRIVDDVISGEAVDITGKKGLWQFMKVSQSTADDLDFDSISSEPGSLTKLEGVWKGKILEENGAISNATLIFSLTDKPVLEVENASSINKIFLTSIAANDKGVKFVIKPNEGEDLDITFLGKLNGRILEGNAEAKNGTRGYWKLVKVSDDADAQKLNLNFLNELCDPVLTSYGETVIFVSDKKVIVPSGKINEGQYKGYMLFDDGTKVEIIFDLLSSDSKMYLISAEDASRIELSVSDLNITDRKIDFKTTIEGDPSTAVDFKGKVFGDYIYGTAVNVSGQELEWELMSVSKTGNLLSNVKRSSTERLNGNWQGSVDFAGLFEQSISMEITKNEKCLAISDDDKLIIDELLLDADDVSFVAHDLKDQNKRFVFNGSITDDKISGKLTTIDGLGIDINLTMLVDETQEPEVKPEESVDSQSDKSIWKGDIGYGDSRAIMVFDFSTDEKSIYIDDFSTDSGRVKLQISDFSQTPKVLKFKAKSPKDPSIVEFIGTINGDIIDGTAKNQLDGSKMLTWTVSKSELNKYEPPKVKHKKSKTKNKFSYLSEVSSVNEVKPEEQLEEEKEKDNISDNKENKEIVENDKSDKKENKPKDKEKKVKDNKNKADKEPEITDKAMYKQSEIDKSEKQLKQMKEEKKASKEQKEKQKKEDKKEKVSKEKKQKKQEDKKKEVEKKSKVDNEKPSSDVAINEVKPEKADKDKSSENVKVTEPNAVNNDLKEQKQDDDKQISDVKPEAFKGKWVGEIQNPSKDTAEMLLELKKDSGYLYLDNEGEKVPFKLVDYSIEGPKITFTLKPSSDADYGIRFEGTLIQGVLSGVAIDPEGKKGKWFAKKI
ncbi:MAG: hypothetical protein AB7V50_00490 [Vampirovibrionia bacterium]